MKNTLVVIAAAAGFLALSCQGNTVGSACTTDKECDYGQSCFSVSLGFPGGFCTKGCVREGATSDCPGGTICTRTSGASPTFFCGMPCNSDGDCRGGQYACRAVAGSDKKACGP